MSRVLNFIQTIFTIFFIKGLYSSKAENSDIKELSNEKVKTKINDSINTMVNLKIALFYYTTTINALSTTFKHRKEEKPELTELTEAVTKYLEREKEIKKEIQGSLSDQDAENPNSQEILDLKQRYMFLRDEKKRYKHIIKTILKDLDDIKIEETELRKKLGAEKPYVRLPPNMKTGNPGLPTSEKKSDGEKKDAGSPPEEENEGTKKTQETQKVNPQNINEGNHSQTQQHATSPQQTQHQDTSDAETLSNIKVRLHTILNIAEEKNEELKALRDVFERTKSDMAKLKEKINKLSSEKMPINDQGQKVLDCARKFVKEYKLATETREQMSKQITEVTEAINKLEADIEKNRSQINEIVDSLYTKKKSTTEVGNPTTKEKKRFYHNQWGF